MGKLLIIAIVIAIAIYVLLPEKRDNTLNLQEAFQSGGLRIEQSGPGLGHHDEFWNPDTKKLHLFPPRP